METQNAKSNLKTFLLYAPIAFIVSYFMYIGISNRRSVDTPIIDRNDSIQAIINNYEAKLKYYEAFIEVLTERVNELHKERIDIENTYNATINNYLDSVLVSTDSIVNYINTMLYENSQ